MRVSSLVGELVLAATLGVAVFFMWPPTPEVAMPPLIPPPITPEDVATPCAAAADDDDDDDAAAEEEEAAVADDGFGGGFIGDVDMALGTLAVPLHDDALMNVRGTLTLGGPIELDFDGAAPKVGTYVIARATAIVGKPERTLVWVGKHRGKHWVAELTTTEIELIANVRRARAHELKGLPRHEPWAVARARQEAEDKAQKEAWAKQRQAFELRRAELDTARSRRDAEMKARRDDFERRRAVHDAARSSLTTR